MGDFLKLDDIIFLKAVSNSFDLCDKDGTAFNLVQIYFEKERQI